MASLHRWTPIDYVIPSSLDTHRLRGLEALFPIIGHPTIRFVERYRALHKLRSGSTWIESTEVKGESTRLARGTDGSSGSRGIFAESYSVK